MILHQIGNIGYLEERINSFWTLFKNDILTLTNKSWKNEDYKGESYTQWNLMQYYNVLSLVILIYFDVKKNGEIYTTWDYYNTKYDLDNKRKCLACINIDLDKVLNIFGLPFENIIGGIENIEIENNFEIN